MTREQERQDPSSHLHHQCFSCILGLTLVPLGCLYKEHQGIDILGPSGAHFPPGSRMSSPLVVDLALDQLSNISLSDLIST